MELLKGKSKYFSINFKICLKNKNIQKNKYMYVYICVCVCIYIYIYIYKKMRRKSRDTWRGSFGVQNEAGESITEFCQENTLVITNTLFQQHRRQLYTWTSPDGQYRNQNDYIICSWWWSSIQSAKTRPGADCGIDHEILIAKCRRKLKKVGKITRSCRYAAKCLQSCPTLCDPIDGSSPNSPIPGIL